MRLHHGGLTGLVDPDDHELRGTQNRDADEDDQAAVVEIVLRHRRPVAADEERLLGLRAEELARVPAADELRRDLLADARPRRLADGRARRPGELAHQPGPDLPDDRRLFHRTHSWSKRTPHSGLNW